MPANIDAMVREGVRAFRAGNKGEARVLLEKAVEADSYNEDAWLWLSAVVETQEEQRTCLENVIVINPNNDKARQGLRSLGIDPDSITSEGGDATAVDEADPFSDTSFVADPPAQQTNTSTDAPRKPRGEDVSSKDYDNWISDLDLGSESSDAPAAAPELGFSDGDFDDLMGDSGSLFGSESLDDEFSNDSAPAAASSGLADDRDALFGDEDIADGPFGTTDSDVGLDSEPAQTSAPAATSPPVMSPGAENVDADLNFLSGIDDSASSGPVPSAIGTDSTQSDDPDAYWALIPDEIEPTRLPGTSEKYPMPIFAGVIVMGMLNLFALIFMISNAAG